MLPEETISLLDLKDEEDWLMAAKCEGSIDDFMSQILDWLALKRGVEDLFCHLNQSIKFKVENDRRQWWRTKSWLTVLELGNHPIGRGERRGLGGRRSHPMG